MRLPLFPLRTVLFPGMFLPVHVFEPRYRQLLRDVLGDGRVFGVALIRSGEEVGGPAEPFDVGCSARIETVRELANGRVFVLARGDRRFAIESLATDEEPYLVCRVRWLPEPEGDEAAELAQNARAAFDEYRLAISSVGTQRYAEADLEPATSAVDLSYTIASRLAIDAAERQLLLESGDASDRLRDELHFLERENAFLREILVRQHARGEGPRPN